ncbi:MAG: hypothetical protein QGI57_04195 [Dehalococcoidales bacterium]|nr:hypothetical protein [Dehalococcoidales bacterium]
MTVSVGPRHRVTPFHAIDHIMVREIASQSKPVGYGYIQLNGIFTAC